MMNPVELAKLDGLPLHSRTPLEWGRAVLADPIRLLIDHAFLEKKAATNAMELLTRWPNDWLEGWVETMTRVARDEAAHLAQVMRILLRRGGRLDRFHKNPYANSLRLLVRKGDPAEILDRLLVSALIEVRSCERFAVLAAASADAELAELLRRAVFFRIRALQGFSEAGAEDGRCGGGGGPLAADAGGGGGDSGGTGGGSTDPLRVRAGITCEVSKWWGCTGSNCGPCACEAHALTN